MSLGGKARRTLAGVCREKVGENGSKLWNDTIKHPILSSRIGLILMEKERF